MKDKTITALAKSRVSYNKSRSVLTAAAIALTTTLLMGLVTSAIGLFDANRQLALAEGNHHAIIRHLTTEQLNMLSNHLEVESLEASLDFAAVDYDRMNGYLTVQSTLKDGIYHGTGNLTEGHFPEAADEICGPPAFFERLDTEPVIGNTLTISFRVGGKGLIQTRQFTICGLVSQRDTSLLEDISDDRIVYSAAVSEALADEYLTPEMRDYTASLRLAGESSYSEDEMETAIHDICRNFGIDTDNIIYNMSYLMAVLSAPTEIAAASLFIGALILFFSCLVIYSIYYVSVITDVREIGKLRALGASKKQVKKLLVSESMRLSAIAIPPGLLFGFGIPALVLPLLMKAAQKNSFTAFAIEHYHMFSPWSFVGVTAAVLIAVRLSLWKPLRMAEKISPIEAIRYQEAAAGAGVKMGHKNVGLLQLCLANLWRNKKRTAVTIVTMGLSCVLFMSFAGTLNSMSALDQARYSIPEGSFNLHLDCSWNDKEYPENNLDTLQAQNLFGEELLERIRAAGGVTNVTKNGYLLFDTDSSAPMFENHTRLSIAPFDRAEVSALRKDITQGEIDYDAMLANNSVICTTYLDWEEMGLSLGEPITLNIHDGDRTIPLTVSVCAVIKDSRHGYFNIPRELWDALDLQYDPTTELYITVEDSSYDKVKTALQELCAENEHFSLYSLDEELQIGSIYVNVVKYPLYGILIMVAVIGCINLVNTMITSIVTRKRELGVLQAIGLSDRQLKRMLSLEGLFFTAGTLLISVTFGNLFGYLIYLFAKKQHFSAISAYHYPVWETLGLAALLTIGQLAITAVLNRRLHAESLIDRIRSGE